MVVGVDRSKHRDRHPVSRQMEKRGREGRGYGGARGRTDEKGDVRVCMGPGGREIGQPFSLVPSRLLPRIGRGYTGSAIEPHTVARHSQDAQWADVRVGVDKPVAIMP